MEEPDGISFGRMKLRQQQIALFFILLLTLLAACGPPTAYRKPLTFRAYEHNPILGPGGPGEWDELVVLIPSVVRHDNLFYLFFSGWRKNGQVSLGLALSEDGYHFKNMPIIPCSFPGKKDSILTMSLPRYSSESTQPGSCIIMPLKRPYTARGLTLARQLRNH